MNKLKPKVQKSASCLDKIIFYACIVGCIAELFFPQEWQPSWELSCTPIQILEFALGITGLIYCAYYTAIFIFNPIKRDWILARGHFLQKVVNYVLLVQFVLVSSILVYNLLSQEDYSPKNLFYTESLYTNENAEIDTLGTFCGTSLDKEMLRAHNLEVRDSLILHYSELPATISNRQKDLPLFYTIFYHFMDSGNQHNAVSADGRRISALIAILGFFLLNGLLISMLISWFDRHREQWIKGEIRYNRFLSRRNRMHYVIIGGNDITKGIVEQLFNNGEMPYILIQTSRETDCFRRELFSTLDDEHQQHIIIYYGNRTSPEDIADMHIENAKELFIIGEDTRTDDIESYHDTMNMECLRLVSENLVEKNNTLVCRVMFEYQTTFSVFQFYDIEKKVRKTVDFRPFNYYEMWAQKVLINREISPAKIEQAFNNGGFMPLEGSKGIKENDNNYVHLFIVGMSRMGVAMAIEGAHLCHYPNFEDKRIRTRITFIDKNAAEEKDFFMGRFKELFTLSHWRYGDINDKGELEWKPQHSHTPNGFDHLGGDFLDIEWEFINGGIEASTIQEYILASATPEAKVSIAICLPESNRSHAAALYLNKRIYKSDSVQQVLVYNRYGNAIVRAISDSGNIHPYCGKLRHFGYSNIQFLNDLKESEEIGKNINNVYNSIKIKQQYAPSPAEYKGKSRVANFWSSIYNGNTMWTKLRSIIYTPETFVNDEKTINILADVEHNRWNIEELLMNFRPLTAEEQNKEKAEKNVNKDTLKGTMAHTDICSNKKLKEIDIDAHQYDIELTKSLYSIYNGLLKKYDNSKRQ